MLVLAEQAGHIVSKDETMARVQPGRVVTEDSLTQWVNPIRRLLEDNDRSLLGTVARRGHVLAVERDTVADGPPKRVDAGPAIRTNMPISATPLLGREAAPAGDQQRTDRADDHARSPPARQAPPRAQRVRQHGTSLRLPAARTC